MPENGRRRRSQKQTVLLSTSYILSLVLFNYSVESTVTTRYVRLSFCLAKKRKRTTLACGRPRNLSDTYLQTSWRYKNGVIGVIY